MDNNLRKNAVGSAMTGAQSNRDDNETTKKNPGASHARVLADCLSVEETGLRAAP